MDYPKEGSTSLYDYSDKSIPQAGYAAIAYAVISTLSTGLAWFRAPATPWIAIVIVALVIGLFFGALAFGIFRKSRIAVVIMLLFVVGLQLYTWFVLRSGSGTVPVRDRYRFSAARRSPNIPGSRGARDGREKSLTSRRCGELRKHSESLILCLVGFAHDATSSDR